MAHYSYHNKISQRINNNELIGYEFTDKHKTIPGNVLILKFDTRPFERPIREHSQYKYKDLIN